MASRAASSLPGDWQMLLNGAVGRSGGLAIFAAAAVGSTAAAVMWRRRGMEGQRHPASKPVEGSARGGDADRASHSTPVKMGRGGGLDDDDQVEEEGRRAIFTPTKLFKGQEECSEVALVDSQLQQLLKEGALQLGSGLDLSSYVQPASLDVPITGKLYHVKEKVLPFQKRVRELIGDLALEERDLQGQGAVLLKGQTYLVYCGIVNLPKGARGCLSPKSSIGRVDMMVRGIVDGCGLYDIVQGGVARELWIEISPRSFNVRVKEGLALTQLMVFMPWDKALEQYPAPADLPSPGRGVGAAGVSMDVYEEKLCFDQSGSPIPLSLHKGAVVLSVCVPSGGRALSGYEALQTEDVIDLSKIKGHIPENFFRPIFSSDGGKLTLEKDRFYILSTKERVSVPNHLSAEMVPFSHHVGELRAHYAGFFDPGFGYGAAGEISGTVGVLEVRPHETINIYHGQPICLMEFFRNSHAPSKPYGFVGSSYQGQEGPKLAKYFLSPVTRPRGIGSLAV